LIKKEVGLLPPASKPWWQQATALVSLSAGGAITGLSFVPKMAADLNSPTSMPISLLALKQSERPAATGDAALRSAIVNVANYYRRMAENKPPAEMQAIIWQHDSIDGVDHGASCAAFASLTLHLAAQVVGQQSWVTGGSTYPWPLHDWADVRVDPNPASLGITSILQDAQAHGRWHPLGDRYRPLPGDWVLFDGHVEVVTKYSNGVLHTVGGDSLPNFSVNPHQYADPLGAQGVAGFVNNGTLASQPKQPVTAGQGASGAPSSQSPGQAGSSPAHAQQPAQMQGGKDRHRGQSATGHEHAAARHGQNHAAAGQADIPGPPSLAPSQPAQASLAGAAAIPGTQASGALGGADQHPGQHYSQHRRHDHPAGAHGHPASQARTLTERQTPAGSAAIPGVSAASSRAAGHRAAAGGHRGTANGAALPAGPYQWHQPASSPAMGSSSQQAFINAVAPGAIAAQHKYGVPAAVTIAQAIEESAWGQSSLATKDNNLFGIKGTGPAGCDVLPTQEFQNGGLVSTSAGFRVYHDAAQSIDDHGRLLATSGYYTKAMAARHSPNAFADALTGVYATDPTYGAKLISLMRQYNLYRYDAAASAAAPGPATPGSPAAASPAGPGTAAIPGLPRSVGGPAHPAPTHRAPGHHHQPGPSRTAPAPSQPGSTTPAPSPSRPIPSGPATPTATAPTPAPSTSPPVTPAPTRSPTGTATPTRLAPSTPAAARPAPTTPARSRSQAAAPTPARSTPSGPTRTRSGPSTPAGNPASSPSIPGIRVPSSARQATPGAGARTGRPAQPGSTAGQANADTMAWRASAPGSRRAAPAPGARRAAPALQTMAAQRIARPATAAVRKTAARTPTARPRPYQARLPVPVSSAVTLARAQLIRDEPLYRDVASQRDISWKLLAACDWMQCEARPGYSAVHGEKLGTVNPDGSVYRTRSEALHQAAEDLADLALAVYQIDLTARQPLSVSDLANVYAAFRWGGLLRLHHTSAMEFPYSVAGLTMHHINMRWPRIADPNTPDKPGARFRMPFGAVPVVLGLSYPATV
jgi:flagellum-specific peptidoglycan hydrolase FlgJ